MLTAKDFFTVHVVMRPADDDAAAIVRSLRDGSEPEAELALASRGLAGGADPTDDPRVDSLKGPNR